MTVTATVKRQHSEELMIRAVEKSRGLAEEKSRGVAHEEVGEKTMMELKVV